MFERLASIGFGPAGWAPALLTGLAMTLFVGLLAVVLGFSLGALLATLYRRGSTVTKLPITAFVQLFRGVPELLVIYLVFFGSGELMAELTRATGGRIEFVMSGVAVGVVALTLVLAAYSSEVFRSAFDAVPKGTIEAAVVMGMSRRKAFFRVILPQMWRYALPGLINVAQSGIKDTALISVIAVTELMRTSHVAANATHDPFLFYGSAAVIYLLIGFFIDTVGRFSEGRIARWAAPSRKSPRSGKAST